MPADDIGLLRGQPPSCMPSARRFPPPWTVEEHNNTCFIVRDATGQALGYFYFEDQPGRRSAAKLHTKNEAAAAGGLSFLGGGWTTCPLESARPGLLFQRTMSKIRRAMSADYEPLFPCVLDDDDVDRLLERLRAVHGEPRPDIAPELNRQGRARKAA